MSGLPAARLGDYHVCPMWTGHHPHIGGPIVQGAHSVMIEGRPAARLGDRATCNGPPDVVVQGSPTVVIEHRPAARIFDRCAHGGVIIQGAARTVIG